MKVCKECGEIKPLDEFYSRKMFSKTKGEYIYYNPECKECTIKRASKWNKEHAEIRREIQKRNNRTPAQKQRMKENSKRWRESGKLKEWQKKHKDKLAQYRNNHRKHEITEKEWKSCKKYFNYSCAYCGMTEEEHKKRYRQQLHKEHVDHEGANDLSNCIPACKNCNSSKHDQNFNDWYLNNANYNEYRYNKIIKWLNEDYKKYKEIK